MDWAKEIRETVTYVIIGLIMAYAINTGLGFALHTQKPVMAVVSNSMEPTIYKGDLIVSKGVSLEMLEVNDIIVYHNPIRHIDIVHRIVGKEQRDGRIEFYTQGDNKRTNPKNDQDSGIAPVVTKELVRGEVVLIIPKLGWFKVILTEIMGGLS